MRLTAYLDQDIGRGDITTELVVPDTDGTASVVCEQDCVVAGVDEAVELFGAVGVDCVVLVSEGDRVKAGTRVLSLSGPIRSIITAERTALNIIMRMSGIATVTADVVESVNGEVVIAATRKTTPGFGDLEKKAVMIGGGDPHRASLESMILIKDNHIRACGGVRQAMERASKASFSIKVEIEVDNIQDAVTAAEMGADIIMADNMGPEDTGAVKEAVRAVNDRILVEASGNITPENAKDYVGKADIVSMGWLTHSAQAVHFSLDIN